MKIVTSANLKHQFIKDDLYFNIQETPHSVLLKTDMSPKSNMAKRQSDVQIGRLTEIGLGEPKISYSTLEHRQVNVNLDLDRLLRRKVKIMNKN